MTSTLRLVIRECVGPVLECAPTALPLDEVHIWHWEPICSPPELTDIWKILAEDERQRAQRYHFSKHRDEFVVNRTRVRSLLAGYVAKAPGQLVFEYSPHGKPSLSDGGGLRFNLSHTHGRTALAVVHERAIGIDVEQIRPQCDARQIAERFFSVRERKSLQGLSGDALDRAFFRGWSRKEAYIKAIGEGLSIPLREFDVSMAEGQPALLLGTRPDPEEASRWDLFDLPLGDLSRGSRYAAALAVARVPSAIQQARNRASGARPA